MKICLINPSVLKDSTISSPLSTRNKYFLNPYNLQHIGLGYISALLIKNGFEVDIIECAKEGLNEKAVCEKVLSEGYDLVGISTYYFNYMSVCRIVNRIRSKNKEVFIYLGGFLPTLSYEMLLQSLDGVNCCMIGEGEMTTLELSQAIRTDKDWKMIKGIAYKENEDVIFTGKRKLIEDLDILPFPTRPFISERKIVSVLTTRGCYGRCTYCGIQEFFQTCEGKRVRRRSPENVVAEIEQLLKDDNIEYITFNDGNFHISSPEGKKWFEKFYHLIKEKNIKIKYLADFRANEIVRCKEILEKFIEIGLHSVNVGIESFVQSQLDFYKKHVSVDQNVEALKIIEELKLRYTIGVLIFDPVIEIEGIYEYLNKIKEINYYSDHYNISRPLSIGSCVIATMGTEIFDYVVKENLYAQNERNYEFKNPKTARCHDLIQSWSEKVIPIFNKNYISYIAEANEKHLENEAVKKLYQDLYIVDHEYFSKVCKAVMDDKAESHYLERLDQEYFKKLDVIDIHLSKLEKELLNYY